MKRRATPGLRAAIAAALLAATAAAGARPARAAASVTVVAFGDSLTAGLGVPPGQSYPAYLQRDLGREGIDARVINLGISGDTTTDALARMDEVLADHPGIVILELGGNDALRGEPLAATRANLSQIIARLRQAHIRILLVGMSLPPNYGGAYIHGFEAIYTDLARTFSLPLVPFIYQDLVPQLRQNPALLQSDGIHASAAGNRIVAGTILRYLNPMLASSARSGR